jgi:pimeloyl-ACP methyl ester carboxylesterase
MQGTGNYAPINGLNLYYEVYGTGIPLVLVHGGGSTINTSFGNIIPLLAKDRQVIAVETQSHGRTFDIDRAFTFEQDADDLAALLNHLQIAHADFMGFSNGGTVCLQMAIRHPQMVNKLIPASACYSRAGMPAGFWDGMLHATLDNMPQPLKDAYLQVNPNPEGLVAMFNRDKNRMLTFKDIDEDDLKTIAAPTLVVNAYNDVILPEHALALARMLPNAQLVVLPGGHGDYIGEICAPDPQSKLPAITADLIVEFLNNKTL